MSRLEKIKSIIQEDGGAPTNCAGGGAVAGIGVGPQGEPGVLPKKRKQDCPKIKSPVMSGIYRRKSPVNV